MTEPTDALIWRRPRAASADAECVEMAHDSDEYVMRNSKHPDVVLRFTQAEIDAFFAGAVAGEFDFPHQEGNT